MSGLEKAAAAKTLSTDFNKVGLRKITALFETTKHNVTRQLKGTLPNDAQNIIVEFASAGGAPSTGAHPTGGSGAGAGAGKWIEDFPLSDSLAGKTLYIQIGRGGLPTPSGTYTFTAANNAGNTFINLLNYSSNLPSLLFLFGGNVFGSGAAPTATRGQASAILTDGNNIVIAGVQPADASAGVQGTSMSMFPPRTLAYLGGTYPPIDSNYKSPYGNYGTTPGSGAGIAAGVGLTGGGMGAFDYPNNVSYNVGTNAGQGALASGGYASFGLRADKYSAMISLDIYGAVRPFKIPNFGASVVVDTPNQELWGAGAVGPATGHMGGYGGDGVLCISFLTAQQEIDPIWTNTVSLIDTTNNPSGLTIPSDFMGQHGWYSVSEFTNGRIYGQDKDSGAAGETLGTVTVAGTVATFTCANGHGLYNARKNQQILLMGMDAGGTDFSTRFGDSAFFGSTASGTGVSATLKDVPPNISGAAGTHRIRYKAVAPSYNVKLIRTHDGTVDWARMALGVANGTLTSGNNTITGITLINRNGFAHLLANQSIKIGCAIVGTGIPANTTVTGVSGSAQGSFTITMSNPASANGAVSARVYNKPLIDALINSPMFVGKKLMFMMSGCPEWLAASIVVPATRTISGTNVTINHAALPYALPVGLLLTVRNSAKTAINGSDPLGGTTFKVTAATTTSTTFVTPTATGNETAVADTAVELIPFNNMQTYGYAMAPNSAIGDGFGEVNNFITWLMTNYGSSITHIDGWNEANTAWTHHGVNRLATNLGQSGFYMDTRDKLGEIVRRTNQAAKAVAPSVQIGSPSITGLSYSQQFYVSDEVNSLTRSNCHYLLSAGDGVGGKMTNWCDYLSIHMYSSSADWRLNDYTFDNIIDWYKFITRLMRMESINIPNMPLIMSEGGHDIGASRIKFYALSDTERANEIFKWFALQAGFGAKAAIPFLSFFLGDPEANDVDEAAYIKVGQRIVGKTLHPDCSYNKFTGEMYFKTTDGYEEYIP